MTSGAVVEVCLNCGAPLELDESGRCRWCHAHIRLEESAGQPAADHPYGSQPTAGQPAGSQPVAGPDDSISLVPVDASDCSTSAPFLYLILGTLRWVLSPEPAVQEFVSSQPGLREQIRTLTTAVSAAGVLKNNPDNNLVVYTADQIWTFNLAADVIALLAALADLPGDVRAKATGQLRSLDGEVVKHHWRKQLKKAGDGPAGFGELRARTPPHKPRPSY